MQQGFSRQPEQTNLSDLYLYKTEETEEQPEWLKAMGQDSDRLAYPSSGLQILIEDRSGLRILIKNRWTKEDWVIQGHHFHSEPLKFYFLVSGELSGVAGRPDSPSFVLQAGQNCLLASSGDRPRIIYHANRPYLAVTILLAREYIRTLLEGKSELPQSLLQAIESSAETFLHIDSTSAAMQVALHQILHCPYKGSIAQIYVKSKAIELIALKLAQIGEQMKQPLKNIPLQPRDIDCIHNAKDILMSNIESPPSLPELARKAGINDYKLKIGFRQVFGTTVFGYLRNQRMERARQLLLEKRMNVSEVAETVGYSSLSRFSMAFKHYFGITPKAYQKNS
ncbi:MAG: helix-turn-helix transcriptional regulator [Cyanobacteria bacterium SBLK]|nr:helix-turn-helix transcriptional regulator [Cyanobacteria bacterium SBLK]